MKTILMAAGFALAMTGSASAGETQLTGPQIREALSDHTYRSADKGKDAEQIFQASGTTYYTENGSQSQGRWEVRGDTYCSNWPPSEAWSCYMVVVDGEVLSFVSASGTRFPVVKVN